MAKWNFAKQLDIIIRLFKGILYGIFYEMLIMKCLIYGIGWIQWNRIELNYEQIVWMK